MMTKRNTDTVKKRLTYIGYGNCYYSLGFLIKLYGLDCIKVYNQTLKEIKQKIENDLGIPALRVEYKTLINSKEQKFLSDDDKKLFKTKISSVCKKLSMLNDRAATLTSIEGAEIYISTFLKE